MKRAGVFFASALLVGTLPLAAQPASPPVPAAAPAFRGLPLPPAMIRLSISDVRAFNTALGGGFRKALTGSLPADDGVAAGFAQSQVGAKLVDQWSRFRGDTALSFQTVLDLQATSAALAVLNIGHLEMVLVLQTPLAALPEIFEAGTSRAHQGKTYHLIRTGAADEGNDGETRMGFAWARDQDLLVVATSERAIKLALSAVSGDARFLPKLDGLASLQLDMDALQKDLYFKRDYFFLDLDDAISARGPIHAALRQEQNRLVEVREGTAPDARARRGVTFAAPDAVASGWIPDGSNFLAELRAAVLEPIPDPADRPQLTVAPLPTARPASAEDRYVVNIDTALAPGQTLVNEAAEIDAWKTLLTGQPLPGFGYVVTKSRARLIAIPWPKEKDAEFQSLIEATLLRRGARLTPGAAASDARQYSFGPGLPALALRRAGDFLWIGPSAADLRAIPAAAWSDEIVRFSKLSLAAVREDGRRWNKVEGPKSSETARPLSDRVLGLLGWMPAVRTFEVERRLSAGAFRERVVFDYTRPAAPPATPAASAPAPVKK